MNNKRISVLKTTVLSVMIIAAMMIAYSGANSAYAAETITLPVYNYGMEIADTINCVDIDGIVYVSLQEYPNLYGNADPVLLIRNETSWHLNAFGRSFVFDSADNRVSWKADTSSLSEQAGHLPPFLKKLSEETGGEEPSNTEYSILLDDYGMTLYCRDDGLYLPFQLASMILRDGMDSFYTCSAAGIYLVDAYADWEDDNSAYPGYYCGNGEYYKNVFGKPRTAEEAAFSYGLICLNMDCFYGFPGVSPIEAEPYNIQIKGLDKALDSTEFGKTAKKYMLSQNWAEYICGLEMLDVLLHDGHCMIPYSNPAYYWNINEGRMASTLSDQDTAYLKELKNRLYSTKEYICLEEEREENAQISRGIWKAREEMFDMPSCISGGEDTYHEQGNAAIISFDDFLIDYESWNDYYTGGCRGEIPYTDCIGTVYCGLKKASENPEIKTVVIDLSDNIGGESEAVSMTLALLTGKAYFRIEDTQTGMITRVNYEADCNFDGVFDERDRNAYSFDIVIMTSESTFSAGSALALFGKDEGLSVVGTPAGGGCCAQQLHADGSGILYCTSSHIRVVNGDGTTTDMIDESFMDKLLSIPSAYTDYYGAKAKDCRIFYDTNAWH